MRKLRFEVYTEETVPQELYKFRYNIYVEEMKRKQNDACHKTKTIKDFLDEKAYHVIAYDHDRIVGCTRANFLREIDIRSYNDFFGVSELPKERLPNTSINTRLMVHPDYRYSRVTHEIMRKIYSFAVPREITINFIDCNSHLLGFFNRWGYRFIAQKNHAEYGDVNTMYLELCDIDHLREVRSPFAPLLEKYLKEQSAVAIAAE